MTPNRTPLLPVAIVTALYLTVAAIASVGNDNWEFVAYIVVVLFAGAGVALLHKQVGLSRGLLWTLSLWGLMHMLGGLLPVPEGWPINGDKRVLYSTWLIPDYLKYDHIVHAFGFAIATWAVWQSLRSTLINKTPTAAILFLCALAGMGLGALNEIVEFLAVLLIPDTNVGGYLNTGWDLVANAVGAFGAAIVIGIMTKKK